MSTIAIDPSGGLSDAAVRVRPKLGSVQQVRGSARDFRVGYLQAMGHRTIYERAAGEAVSVVVTPSLVKKLR
jgi:hypothetical protein